MEPGELLRIDDVQKLAPPTTRTNAASISRSRRNSIIGESVISGGQTIPVLVVMNSANSSSSDDEFQYPSANGSFASLHPTAPRSISRPQGSALSVNFPSFNRSFARPNESNASINYVSMQRSMSRQTKPSTTPSTSSSEKTSGELAKLSSTESRNSFTIARRTSLSPNLEPIGEKLQPNKDVFPSIRVEVTHHENEIHNDTDVSLRVLKNYNNAGRMRRNSLATDAVITKSNSKINSDTQINKLIENRVVMGTPQLAPSYVGSGLILKKSAESFHSYIGPYGIGNETGIAEAVIGREKERTLSMLRDVHSSISIAAKDNPEEVVLDVFFCDIKNKPQESVSNETPDQDLQTSAPPKNIALGLLKKKADIPMSGSLESFQPANSTNDTIYNAHVVTNQPTEKRRPSMREQKRIILGLSDISRPGDSKDSLRIISYSEQTRQTGIVSSQNSLSESNFGSLKRDFSFQIQMQSSGPKKVKRVSKSDIKDIDLQLSGSFSGLVNDKEADGEKKVMRPRVASVPNSSIETRRRSTLSNEIPKNAEDKARKFSKQISKNKVENVDNDMKNVREIDAVNENDGHTKKTAWEKIKAFAKRPKSKK